MNSFGSKNRRKTKAVGVLSALKIVYIKSEEPPKILKPAGLLIFLSNILKNVSCETVPLKIPELLSLVYTVKVRRKGNYNMSGMHCQNGPVGGGGGIL